MDKHFEVAVGSAATDQQLEFRAFSVVVDNPTNQWVSLDALGIVIPQYTLGATYPMSGTQRARFSFTAPTGQVEPPTIAGQVVSVTFYDLALPLTAGVGMLGGRAPYYDRNPTTVAKGYSGTAVAPHALTNRFTYTVPAGRRSYMEAAQCITTIDGAGASGTDISSILSITPVGGTITSIIQALIWGANTLNTFSVAVLGVSMELQPGEIITAQTINLKVGGTATHAITAKFTEFDA